MRCVLGPGPTGRRHAVPAACRILRAVMQLYQPVLCIGNSARRLRTLGRWPARDGSPISSWLAPGAKNFDALRAQRTPSDRSETCSRAAYCSAELESRHGPLAHCAAVKALMHRAGFASLQKWITAVFKGLFSDAARHREAGGPNAAHRRTSRGRGGPRFAAKRRRAVCIRGRL